MKAIQLCHMHAMVTGASGSIGRALTNTLLESGCKVTLLVRDVRSLPKFLGPDVRDRLRVIVGDLSNIDALSEAADGVEAIFHAAARVHSVPRTPSDIAGFYDVNVKGTENLLNSIRGQKVRSFVFFSTIAVFGETNATLNESTPPNPVSPYAISKYQAEAKILEAADTQGFSPSVLRLSMVYGPGDRGNFQRMIRAVERGRFVLIGSGDTLKSMTYVHNVVEAALLAVAKPEGSHPMYVISDSRPYSLREVVSLLAQELGKPAPRLRLPAFVAKTAAHVSDAAARISPVWAPITSRDVEVLLSNVICDTGLAQHELGFKAKIPIEEGIALTVRDYRTRRG